MKVSEYAKSIVMVLAAGLGIFTAAISDGVVSPVEWVNIGISLVAAVGVYLIPNLSSGAAAYAKSIVAFGGAALAALALIVANVANFGVVTPSDWLGVVLAGLGAIGLYIVPNSKAVTPATTKAAAKKA
jgi:hypothetical protein